VICITNNFNLIQKSQKKRKNLLKIISNANETNPNILSSAVVAKEVFLKKENLRKFESI
jgi:hypothetical protein